MSHLMLAWQVSPTDATWQGLIIWELQGQYLTWILILGWQHGRCLIGRSIEQVSDLNFSTAGASPLDSSTQVLTWALVHLNSGTAGASHLNARMVDISPGCQYEYSSPRQTPVQMCTFLLGVSTGGTSPGLQPVLQESLLDVTYQPSAASKTNAKGLGICSSILNGRCSVWFRQKAYQIGEGDLSPATLNAVGSGSLSGLWFASVWARWLIFQGHGQLRLGWLWGHSQESSLPTRPGPQVRFPSPSLGKCQTQRGSSNLDNYGHYYYFLSLNGGQITHLNTTTSCWPQAEGATGGGRGSGGALEREGTVPKPHQPMHW